MGWPKGKPRSEETKRKLSKIASRTNLGRKHSKETRQKISNSVKNCYDIGTLEPMSREKNPMWNGGTNTRKGGYKMILDKDNPMADHKGYVYEHRLRAAKALGRPLKSNEHVHHVHDKEDNLIVCDPSYHRWLHKQLEKRGGYENIYE